MTAGDYRLCSRCIMDTTDPDITFEDGGECSWCRWYDLRVRDEVFAGTAGERRLSEIVRKVKERGRGKRYDCIMGVSGGVDSTAALVLLRDLGLRVLAVHLDNGWNSELAVDNIKRALEGLGVDLYTYVLAWEEFRDVQLSFLKASVSNCELPTDHAIVALNFRVAREQGIQYIFNGGNVRTEAFMPPAWSYDARDLKHLRAVHRQFGRAKIRSLPTMGIGSSLYAIVVRGIRWVTVLNYVNYRKEEAVRMLQERLGWRPYGGKHYESVYTRFYQGYILPVKFGFDKRRAHLSSVVLSGEMTRQAALEKISDDGYRSSRLLQEDRKFVIKKLGLSEAEFGSILAQPPRSHYDYPTDRLLFERMPRLFRAFKRVATHV